MRTGFLCVLSIFFEFQKQRFLYFAFIVKFIFYSSKSTAPKNNIQGQSIKTLQPFKRVKLFALGTELQEYPVH